MSELMVRDSVIVQHTGAPVSGEQLTLYLDGVLAVVEPPAEACWGWEGVDGALDLKTGSNVCSEGFFFISLRLRTPGGIWKEWCEIRLV